MLVFSKTEVNLAWIHTKSGSTMRQQHSRFFVPAEPLHQKHHLTFW